MRKAPFFILLLVLLQSCNKKIYNDPQLDDNLIEKKFTLNQDSGQDQFAQILSRAAYDREDIRAFIKEKVLEQFDNDYDVFYPLIKDEIVSDNESFRNILVQYSNNLKQLSAIDEALPLLNILVPDLTLYTDFNAENWDTSDTEVLVTSLNKSDSQLFYEAGV